jgi:hypothetical protein
MHEARLLAESGFKGSQSASMEQRYERAEELFARLKTSAARLKTALPATTAAG